MAKLMTREQRVQLGAKAGGVAPPSVGAPIKGWNTRDALTAMDPLDAVQLDNPGIRTQRRQLRNGYVVYATGLGAARSRRWRNITPTGRESCWRPATGRWFDVSASGAVGAAVSASGFTACSWQTEQFLSNLFFVNVSPYYPGL